MKGKKETRLKWSQTMIAREFGKDSRTVGKMLAASDLDRRNDLTTPQVFSAMLGDLSAEKLRLTREQADKVALENQQARKELVSAADVVEVVQRGLAAMTAAVMSASNLEHEDKAKIIDHLRQTGESVVGIAGGGETTPELHGQPVE